MKKEKSMKKAMDKKMKKALNFAKIYKHFVLV